MDRNTYIVSFGGGMTPSKFQTHDLASNKVNMADKVRKFEDFRQKSDGG